MDASFADDWQAYLDSGLYDRLREESVVIPHVEVEPELAAAQPAYRVIRPDPVDFISYPYEWSFSRLRDASTYDVQFYRGKPILIDSLSFERAVDERPWAPYRQFCEHFLVPLAPTERDMPPRGRVSGPSQRTLEPTIPPLRLRWMSRQQSIVRSGSRHASVGRPRDRLSHDSDPRTVLARSHRVLSSP